MFEEVLVAGTTRLGLPASPTTMSANGLGICRSKSPVAKTRKRPMANRLPTANCAPCVTEPEAGSNVAGIRTTARKQGDYYVLNGSKTFITNATNANFYTVFAYTDQAAKHKGISCFIVERDWEGSAWGSRLIKWVSTLNTAEVIFDNVKVPESYLVGAEGQVF